MTAREDAERELSDARRHDGSKVATRQANATAGVGWALLDLADAVREFADMPRPELAGFVTYGQREPRTTEQVEERAPDPRWQIRDGIERALTTGPLRAVRDVEAQLDRWIVEGDGATRVSLSSMVGQLRALIRTEGCELAPLSIIEVPS